MKIVPVCGIAFALVAAPALADGPPPTYVAPSPNFSWSGIYLGINGGYGWATTSTNTGPHAAGAVAGGQVGFNWQTGALVLGLEADAQWSGQKQTETFCGFLCVTETSGIDFFGTARLRLGVAVDRVLIYGTGGAAWMQVSGTATGPFVNLSAHGSGAGWAAGGGVEFALPGNTVTTRIEYLYMQVPGMTVTSSGFTSAPFDVTDSIVRASVNFRFPSGN
jgi:outer membrane immunogenic protein